MADADFDTAFERVRATPTDWAAWTVKGGVLSLADTAAVGGTIAPARAAYPLFLTHYPACFGFWKKWAAHEWLQGIPQPDGRVPNIDGDAVLDAALAVYEAGVAAVTHSVEHWINYAEFCVARGREAGGAARTRDVLTRALAACVLDPKAGALWSLLVAHEVGEGGGDATQPPPPAVAAAVAATYARALRTNAAYVGDIWLKFGAWAASAPAATDLLAPGEAEDAALAAEVDARASAAAVSEAGANGGEADNSSEAVTRRGDVALRVSILSRREASARASLEVAQLRRGVEAAVGKRSYYHVKPLDAAALQGWRDYLEYETAEVTAAIAAAEAAGTAPGSASSASAALPALVRLEKVWGRCLVATANYSEFWLRRAAWLTTSGALIFASLSDADMHSLSAVAAIGSGAVTAYGMRAALSDSVTLLRHAIAAYTPRRIDVHLTLALSLEATGRGSEAVAHIAALLKGTGEGAVAFRKSAELAVRHAHLLRRAGQRDAAADVLTAAIAALSEGETFAALPPEPVAGAAGGAAPATGAAAPSSNNTLGPAATASAVAALYDELARLHASAGGGDAAAAAARAEYEKSVVALPHCGVAWRNFAVWELSAGRSAAALAILTRALGLGSSNSSGGGCHLSPIEALDLWSMYLHILEETSTSASALVHAHATFALWRGSQGSASPPAAVAFAALASVSGRKRAAEAPGAAAAAAAAKVPRVELPQLPAFTAGGQPAVAAMQAQQMAAYAAYAAHYGMVPPAQ